MNTSLQTPPRGVDFFWNFTRLALQYFQTLSPPGQCLSQILPLRTSMFALKSFLPLVSWEGEQEEQFIGCAGRSGGWLSYKGFSPSSPNYSSQTINYQTIRLQFQFLQGGKNLRILKLVLQTSIQNLQLNLVDVLPKNIIIIPSDKNTTIKHSPECWGDMTCQRQRHLENILKEWL